MSKKLRSSLFYSGLFGLALLYTDSSVSDEWLLPRFLVLSGFALVAFWFIPAKNSLKDKASFTLTDVSVAALVIVAFLSCLWAFNGAEALFESQKLLLFAAIYFLSKWLIKSDPEAFLRQCFRIGMIFSLIKSLIILGQIASTAKSGIPLSASVYAIDGFSGHKNLAASALLLLLPFNLAGILRSKGLEYMGYLTAIGLILLDLALLQTRAVFVALLAAGIMAVLLYSLRRRLSKDQFLGHGQKIFLILGGIGLLIAVTLIFSDLPASIGVFDKIDSASGVERLHMWSKTASMIKQDALLGVGHGNWKIAMPAGGLSGLGRAEFSTYTFIRPHNDFLWVWAELGLFGLISYLAIFILHFGNGLSVMAQGKKTDVFTMIFLLAGITAYFVNSLLDFPKERPEHLVLLALMLALVSGLHKSGTKPFSWELPSHKLLLGIASIGLLLNVGTGYARLQSEQHMVKTIQFKEAKNRPEMKREAQAAFSSIYTVDQQGIPVKWYEGIASYFQGEHEEALALFQEATVANPNNHHVQNNLGSAYFQQGNLERAGYHFNQALIINPSFDGAKLNMAAVYINLKKWDKAMAWIQSTAGQSQRRSQLEAIIRSNANPN